MGKKCSKYFAPATVQAPLPSFIFATKSIGVVNRLWKILAFRSFYISQLIRMTTEAVALLGRPPALLIFVH